MVLCVVANQGFESRTAIELGTLLGMYVHARSARYRMSSIRLDLPLSPLIGTHLVISHRHWIEAFHLQKPVFPVEGVARARHFDRKAGHETKHD